MSNGAVQNGGADEGGRAASSFLASKINVAPFVPSTLPSATGSSVQNQQAFDPRKGSPAGLSAESVRAAPFVPGSGGSGKSPAGANANANASPQSVPSSPQRPTTKMSAAAASFVPKPADASPAAGTPRTVRRLDQRLADSDSQFGMMPHGSSTMAPGSAGMTPGPSGMTPPFRSPRAPDMGPPSYRPVNMHPMAPGFRSPPPKGTPTPSPPPPISSPGKPFYAARGGRGGRIPDLGGRMGRRGGGYGHPHISMAQSAQSHYLLGLGKMQASAKYLSEAVKQQLQQQAYLAQAQWQHSDGLESSVPERLGSFHTLLPLEDVAAAEEQLSASLGVRSLLLKGISTQDGAAYALRRIDGRQVIPAPELMTAAHEAVEAWAPLASHPNLVGLRAAFVTDDTDGPSLVFVHDLHAAAVSLAQAHLQPSSTPQGLATTPPSGERLWSYLLQLTTAVRAVHSAGLALRAGCLHPSKVLLTPFGRLRVGSVGVLDALSGEAVGGEAVPALQREDLAALGRLLLSLACTATQPAPPSLDYMTHHFSGELVRVTAALLGAADGSSSLTSWRHLAAAVSERVFGEMEGLALYNDGLLTELAKEAENGRIARLLIKLGYVNERPESDMDPQWAETGDRYLLKLFRDFVFHQVTEDGTPMLDWGHVIEALNKLDAGTAERVLLMSRDEAAMLVVSYADVKRCVEGAYSELRHGAQQPHKQHMRRLSLQHGGE